MADVMVDDIFKDIVETIREPLLVLDSDLKVILASHSFYGIFKVKPEETVGQLIYDLGNKQWDIPKLRELLENILPEKTAFDNYEVVHDFATIGRRTMLLNARQIERGMGKKQIILLAIEDITERVQTETILKNSEEQYRRLFETANDGILLLEKSKLEIRHANPAIIAMLGYSSEELVGSDMKSIGFPNKIGAFQEIMQTLNKDGIAHFEDVAVNNKDGRAIYADIYMTDRAVLVQCNIRDITESKKAKESLKESEENYRILFDNAPDLIVVFNAEGNLLDLNKKFEEESGYSREEMIGKSIFTSGILAESSVNRSIPFFKKILAGEKRVLFEVEGVTKDGGKISYELMAVPIKKKDGKIVAVQATLRNITERKQIEQEKEKLRAQLIQAQKMEAIGTLAGGIAHDFNNILSAVIGYTELARMKLEADSEIKDDLKEVHNAAVRAKDLVKQILAFSRQTQEERMPVQTSLLVKEALKLIRSTLPTTIDIRQNIQSKSVVLSDPTQLHQIVMNLCTNAAHAMHGESGILEATLTDVEIDSDFCSTHPEIQPGAYQKLTVSDTGHGITPGVMNRIFDPFFTTKPKGEGTGLGLSVVHGIVKDCGGTITVYSEPDKETAFNLYFPIIKGEAEEKLEEQKIIPTGTERILVVDDEKTIVDITRRILTSLGYEVEARTSSLEALELFEAIPNKFDLVITDMTMPRMTGDMLARELMKIRPDLPIILCTGFSQNITREKAETMGIKAFLMKPLLKEEMAHTIRRVLDEAKNSSSG